MGIPTGIGFLGIHVPSPLEKDINQAVLLENVVGTFMNCIDKFAESCPVGWREEHVGTAYATTNKENIKDERVPDET